MCKRGAPFLTVPLGATKSRSRSTSAHLPARYDGEIARGDIRFTLSCAQGLIERSLLIFFTSIGMRTYIYRKLEKVWRGCVVARHGG